MAVNNIYHLIYIFIFFKKLLPFTKSTFYKLIDPLQIWKKQQQLLKNYALRNWMIIRKFGTHKISLSSGSIKNFYEKNNFVKIKLKKKILKEIQIVKFTFY